MMRSMFLGVMKVTHCNESNPNTDSLTKSVPFASFVRHSREPVLGYFQDIY